MLPEIRAWSGGELAERVRAEDYAALGAKVVVELHTEKPRRQALNPGVGDHPPRPTRPPLRQRPPTPP